MQAAGIFEAMDRAVRRGDTPGEHGGRVEIRRVGEGGGARLRALRLRAPEDAPYAFSSSFEREAAFPAAVWAERAAASAAALTRVTFVGVEDGTWCAMVAAAIRAQDVRILGMWVAPEVRRRGVGRGLMAAVEDWARERGVRRLELAVTESVESQPAAALYGALGFAATGERAPLGSDPSFETVTLARVL